MTKESPLDFSSAGLKLCGTLTQLDTRPLLGAVLLVSGSGPIDRDSNMKRAALAVMQQVAGHLAAQGFASYRFDKRGVGQSEGDYKATGLHDNIADARAALDALRAQPGIDPGRVFVLGHSEGAAIVAALATETSVAGAILLAGTAQSGKAVLRWQAQQVAETLPKWVRFVMKLLRQDFIRSQEKRMAQLEATTQDVERISLVKVNAKWFREFMAHDPRDSLRRVSCPVLAITGAKDIQVDPADLQLMQAVAGGPFEAHVLDDLTHLLRRDEGPPSLDTYKKQMREPVDARLLELVSDWLHARVQASPT